MTVYLMPEMLTDDELESMLADLGLLEDEIKGFNPTQPRDEDGKWTDGGGSGGSGSGSTAGPEDSEAAREAAAAHVKYTLTTARTVAKELGIDPAMMSIGPSKSPEASFTLNGVERKAAGVAFVHEGLNKGRIKLFPENMTAEFVIGCTAHEIRASQVSDGARPVQGGREASLERPRTASEPERCDASGNGWAEITPW